MIAVASPAIVPFRWVGHGVDVCVTVRNREVRFIARDVLEALGQELQEPLLSDPSHVGPLLDHVNAAAWTVEQACNVIGVLDTRDSRQLELWMADRVAEVHAWHDEAPETPVREPVILPGVDPASIAIPDATAEERTWSVAQVAKILSRDPSIQIGQHSLFDWMHMRAWIEKHSDVWVPNSLMLAIGYLRTLERKIPAQKDPYPQILITGRGIQKLHELLGGTATIDLNSNPLTLVEE